MQIVALIKKTPACTDVFLVELPGTAPGSARITHYASTGLACLKFLDCLPVNKQKANNQSLKVLQPKLKRHYGWQPEKYETLLALSDVGQ